MATERQVAANRVNGLKGGVKTEAGKAISRMNARKHGIFASALTEYDDEELHGIEERLDEQLAPVGIIEEMLVEKVAVTYLRMQRCARAEAQHHREMWASPGSIIVRGKREKKIAAIGLYDLRLTNQFLRLLREIKSLQRERTAQRRDPHGSAYAPLSIAQIPSNDGDEDERHSSERGVLNGDGEVRAGERRLDSPRSKANGCILRGGNDESQAEAPVPRGMENEPNPSISECRAPSAESHPKRKNEPNSASRSDSPRYEELGRSDNAELKNEPNSLRAALHGNDESQVRSPVSQELKNEPNSSRCPVENGRVND